MPASRVAVLVVLSVLAGLWKRASTALPERVASHFDWSGDPDGWVTRTQFLVLFAVLGAVVAGLGLGLPALVRRLPASAINLPHRDHWLAPERREATLAFLGDQLAWLGALTGVLMAALFWRTIELNLEPETGRLTGGGWLVGGYLAAVAVWTARLMLRFRRIPEAA